MLRAMAEAPGEGDLIVAINDLRIRLHRSDSAQHGGSWESSLIAGSGDTGIKSIGWQGTWRNLAQTSPNPIAAAEAELFGI
jgi:hypothetical protein